MFKGSDISNVTRREFLLGAGTVVTTGYLVIGGPSRVVVDPSLPPPAADHVATFDVTQGSIACFEDSVETLLCEIYAKIGEVVNFKAVTTSKGKRHVAVLFVDDTPFVDKDGDDVWAFHGSGDEEKNGIGKDAKIRPGLLDGQTFEFTVGVWDESDSNKTKTYTKDPTIVIGKGGPSVASAIAKLTAADRLLKHASDNLQKSYPTFSEDLNSIDTTLNTLIGKLKALLNKPQGQTK